MLQTEHCEETQPGGTAWLYGSCSDLVTLEWKLESSGFAVQEFAKKLGRYRNELKRRLMGCENQKTP